VLLLLASDGGARACDFRGGGGRGTDRPSQVAGAAVGELHYGAAGLNPGCFFSLLIV